MPRRIVQMSDDQDAFDDLERDPGRSRKWNTSIILPILVTIIVSAGATVIAWYSYNTGVREGSEVAAPLLKPQGPAKVTPESPGGLAIPHQDKTVFQAIEGGASDMKVERLLPPPEAPANLPAQTASPAGPEGSQVRRAERLESDVEQGRGVSGEGSDGPTRLTPSVGLSAPPETSSQTAPPPPAVPGQPDSGTATVTMPTPTKRSTPQAAKDRVSSVKSAPAPKQPVLEQKSSVARATPPSKPGIRPGFGYGIQIASLTAKAKADDFWKRQANAHRDLLGDLSLFVHTVRVKGKTYHRVQGGTFADRPAANNVCSALRKRGVGCVVVNFGK